MPRRWQWTLAPLSKSLRGSSDAARGRQHVYGDAPTDTPLKATVLVEMGRHSRATSADRMSFVIFILLGLAVCGFTHALFNTSRMAVMVDLGVAVIGAVMAGALFNHIAATGAAVLSITDALVAAVAGAVGLLAAYHAALRCTWYRRRG